MAYDPVRGRVVLFGGVIGATPLGDTWEWDGSRWRQVNPTSAPSPRLRHAMAFDPVQNKVLLFGGGPTSMPLAETWSWDGTSWVMARPAVTPPAIWPALVTDTGRRRVLLLPHCYEWDGVNWQAIAQPASAMPSFGAYDATRGQIVVPSAAPWLYGASEPAGATDAGRGCGAANRVPRLAGNVPFLGNLNLTFDVADAAPQAPCAIVLGSQVGALELAPGCTLRVAMPWITASVLTNQHGFASVRASVPLAVALRGRVFFAQAVVADPAANAGLALSNARKFAIGD